MMSVAENWAYRTITNRTSLIPFHAIFPGSIYHLMKKDVGLDQANVISQYSCY